MHHIGDVRIAKPIVSRDPEPREPLSPVLLVLRGLRVLVRHALAVGVVGEKSQANVHLMLISDLHRVVAAGRVCRLVGRVARKAGASASRSRQ